MKVLRIGKSEFKKNEKETMHVNCKHCNAKLEIEPKDVTNIGCLFPCFCFECPECKGITAVKTKKMPQNFKYWVFRNNEDF